MGFSFFGKKEKPQGNDVRQNVNIDGANEAENGNEGVLVPENIKTGQKSVAKEEAIEKSQVSPKRIYRAAIACATGIGTSRLLATRIEREYDNIEVVDITSTLRIEKSWLKETGVEFTTSLCKRYDG